MTSVVVPCSRSGQRIFVDEGVTHGAEPALAPRTRPGAPAERAPASSFVGRAADVEHVVSLLHQHRMVTLTGPGGVGKTRPALEVVGCIGAALGPLIDVDLSAIEDPRDVVRFVAGSIGVKDSSGTPLFEQVVEWCADRRCLVLFDNCEHVGDEGEGEQAVEMFYRARALSIAIGDEMQATWDLGSSALVLHYTGERAAADGRATATTALGERAGSPSARSFAAFDPRAVTAFALRALGELRKHWRSTRSPEARATMTLTSRDHGATFAGGGAHGERDQQEP
jgi:hypothetical protein